MWDRLRDWFGFGVFDRQGISQIDERTMVFITRAVRTYLTGRLLQKDTMITTQQVSALLGKNIELVCFAHYSLYIHFEGGAILTVEAEFEIADGRRNQSRRSTFPIPESSLMRILQCSVTSADVDETGNLLLSFSNGDILRVYKEPEFESYCVRIGDQELRP